jgi:hypothetical protein
VLITFVDRPSDSTFVERVWRSHSDRTGVFHSIAACTWDIVVMRLEGRTTLIVRGPETKATMADCPPQGEWFGVRFKPGTFMPLMRSSDMRDRNNVTLPNATRRSFWLNGSAWDFPDFENAEVFVNRLARAGLIMADHTVGLRREHVRRFYCPKVRYPKIMYDAGSGVFWRSAFPISHWTLWHSRLCSRPTNARAGIRIALGAQSGNILRLITEQGLKIVGVGLVTGIGGALVGTHLIQGALYGVAPIDPISFGVSVVILGIAAVLACLLPALRAARINPIKALRE